MNHKRKKRNWNRANQPKNGSWSHMIHKWWLKGVDEKKRIYRDMIKNWWNEPET